MRKLILVILSLSLVNCKSSDKFAEKITEKNCELALELVPENQTGYRMVSKAQEVSGTLLSYSATGAAYTVQILWDVTATVGAAVVLCAPTLAVAYAAKVNRSQNFNEGICMPANIKKIQAPYLGINTRENTENWNCPDVDAISRSMRQVAQCYNQRGGEENRKKALEALKSVESSGSFYRCLSNKERQSFIDDLALVKSSALN